MTPIPITEAVQAAIYFAKYKKSTLSEYCWACDKMERELTDQDKDRVSPQLAAAARILAAEVERLRGGQPQTADYVSGCCHAKTETAGHKNPGIKVWFWCTSCRKPCDIFFADHKAQSEKTQP
jgi:hypothetical protein